MKLFLTRSHQQNYSAPASSAVLFSKRRVGLQMIGVFSFIAFAALLTSATEPATPSKKAAVESNSDSSNLNLQVAPDSSAKPATSQSSSSSTDSSPAPADSTSSSTNVTSTSTNGSTQVTINGQAVPVPANGTVTKKMSNSDGGTTQVTVSQSNGDSAGGSAALNNNVEVFDHTPDF